MKKKFFRVSALLFLIIGLLVGCGTDNQEQEQSQASNQNESTQSSGENTEQKSEDTVTVTISKNNGEKQIKEKEIEIKDGAILMEVMKENFEIKEDGGFITSINGIAPGKDEKKAWMYTVNGEMAKVGATELELSPGDKVVFDLQAY
ncbi:DUF4430 domain-containing protein [Virgibacillus kekensis]|uniref:DUF4430 domain-containing protein n=1 Tax=Virgibacillus kekensis TaxID=202261 RepID=A0ABV9DF95_9BACI